MSLSPASSGRTGSWPRLPNSRLAFVLAVAAVAVVGVLWIADLNRDSPEKQVRRRLKELVAAVESSDRDRILAILSPQCPEREEIGQAARMVRVKGRLSIKNVAAQTTNEGTRVVTRFRANGTVALGGFEQHVATQWELSWRPEAGQWAVYEIRRLSPVNDRPVGILSGAE